MQLERIKTVHRQGDGEGDHGGMNPVERSKDA